MKKKNCTCQKLSDVLKALSDYQRLTIVEFINKHKRVNVSEVVRFTGLSQPTISHHLKILTTAKILTSEKVGKEVYYQVIPARITNCCEELSSTLCSCEKK